MEDNEPYMIKFSNITKSHIIEDITASATKLKVPDGAYGNILTGGTSAFFVLRDQEHKEIVKIDIENSNEFGLAVSRGEGGTQARDWPFGTLFYQELTEGALNIFKTMGIYRTIDYNPNGILAPNYANERVYQSSLALWWQSVGITNEWVLIAGYLPRIWTACYSYPMQVMKISVESESVTAQIFFPNEDPYSVIIIGDYLYVGIDGGYGTPGVKRIDKRSNNIDSVIDLTGSRVRGLEYDGTFLWAIDFSNNDVLRIDLATDTVKATVGVGRGNFGFSYGGGYICVTNNYDNTVSMVDVSTDLVVATISVGTRPYRVTYCNGYFWVSCSSVDKVYVIDPLTMSVFTTVSVGNAPYGMSSDGTHVFSGNMDDDSISKIDAATMLVVDTFQVVGNPALMTTGGGFLWIVCGGGATIAKMNTATGNSVYISLPDLGSVGIAYG